MSQSFDFQTPNRPTRTGDRGHNAPTRLPRVQTTRENGSSQETRPQSSSGESDGDEAPVHYILPEGGDGPADEMVVQWREWLVLLRERVSKLSEEGVRVPRGSDEWYEIIDEIASISYTGDIIRGWIRSARRNR